MKKKVELPRIGRIQGTVLSLDLGRRMGWAILSGGRYIDSGVHELYDPNGRVLEYEDGARFAELLRFLNLIDQWHDTIDIVAFEQVPAGAMKGRQRDLYPGYRALVMSWAHSGGKQVVPIPVTTVKRLVTGNGAAGKIEMTAAAVKNGYLPFDDNESDALGVMVALGKLSEDPAAFSRSMSLAQRMRNERFRGELEILRPKSTRKRNASNWKRRKRYGEKKRRDRQVAA